MQPIQYYEAVTNQDYHVYEPRTQNFGNSHEIRINVQHQDVCTLPSESFLKISGTVNVNAGKVCKLVTNGYAFLFNEIRYEINGIEVDGVRDVGITATMKGYLSHSNNDLRTLVTAGWSDSIQFQTNAGATETKHKFCVQIPLKCMLGFAEDYKKIMVNVKQELILFRSRADVDCFKTADGAVFDITKIEWYLPHVQLNDELKLKLLNDINKNKPILIPFRRWELHELPSLRTTIKDIWTVKTSNALERPRYVIIAYQTNRRDVASKNPSEFDHCNIRNIKLYLNSHSYPYTPMNLDIENDDYSLAYLMYNQFQTSYYNKSEASPILTFEQFKSNMLYVFDVSKQNETFKSSAIDLKIEMEANQSFPANTRAYCLILYDTVFEYTPLSGLVRKIV